MSGSSVLSRLCSTGLVLSFLMQGCGGGDPVPSSVGAESRGPASVRIEGCVVDEFFIPHEGVPVRALSADGRTLGYATSGHRGEFVLHLPSRAPVALRVDRDGGEWMRLAAQDRDQVIESCLLARHGA